MTVWKYHVNTKQLCFKTLINLAVLLWGKNVLKKNHWESACRLGERFIWEDFYGKKSWQISCQGSHPFGGCGERIKKDAYLCLQEAECKAQELTLILDGYGIRVCKKGSVWQQPTSHKNAFTFGVQIWYEIQDWVFPSTGRMGMARRIEGKGLPWSQTSLKPPVWCGRYQCSSSIHKLSTKRRAAIHGSPDMGGKNPGKSHRWESQKHFIIVSELF